MVLDLRNKLGSSLSLSNICRSLWKTATNISLFLTKFNHEGIKPIFFAYSYCFLTQFFIILVLFLFSASWVSSGVAIPKNLSTKFKLFIFWTYTFSHYFLIYNLVLFSSLNFTFNLFYMVVLVGSFVNLTQVKIIWKREPQLRNASTKLSYKQYGGSFLINDWCERAWPTVGGTTPRQASRAA